MGNYIKMLFYIITVVVHHDKEVVCANYRKMTAEDIHNNEKERQRDAIVNFFKTYGTQSNIMDDIGHYLVLLSSSESPHKIIEKMLPNLSALLVGGNSPKSKFSIVEEVPEKVLEYSRRVVVVLLSYQLLLPWRVPRVSCQRDEALSTIPIDSETIDDNFIRANSKALNGLMDLLVSTTVAILSSSYTWLESPILNDRVNPYSIIHKYIDKPIYFTKQLICALNVSKTVIEYQTKGNSQNDQDVVVYIFPSLITAMNSYGSSANCDAIVLLRFMNGLKTVTKHVSKVNYQLLLENREHLSNSLTLITDRYQNSEEKLAIEIRDSVQDFFINL